MEHVQSKLRGIHGHLILNLGNPQHHDVLEASTGDTNPVGWFGDINMFFFRFRKCNFLQSKNATCLFFEDTFVGGDYFGLTFLLIWYTPEKRFKFALEEDSKCTRDNKIQTSSIPKNLKRLFPWLIQSCYQRMMMKRWRGSPITSKWCTSIYWFHVSSVIGFAGFDKVHAEVKLLIVVTRNGEFLIPATSIC